MKDEIELLLPLIQSRLATAEQINELLKKLRKAIKDQPSKGKELGQGIALINAALKTASNAGRLNWQSINQGFVAIGHKPGGQLSFKALKGEGTKTVLTLLHENEGAIQIGWQTKQAAIDWLWFPFSASLKQQQTDLTKVVDLYVTLQQMLQAGAKIYIHCSAGIHRTGMITYGLLRYLGYDKNEAMQMLNNLRPVTAQQVGHDRLLWGDKFCTEN